MYNISDRSRHAGFKDVTHCTKMMMEIGRYIKTDTRFTWQAMGTVLVFDKQHVWDKQALWVSLRLHQQTSYDLLTQDTTI